MHFSMTRRAHLGVHLGPCDGDAVGSGLQNWYPAANWANGQPISPTIPSYLSHGARHSVSVLTHLVSFFVLPLGEQKSIIISDTFPSNDST